MIAYGSLYNSLPMSIFDTNRYLLGEGNSKIREIENTLACSIAIDQSLPQHYRFIITDQNLTIMNLALVQIEALVKQTQYQYLIAFASNIGISLRSSIHRMGAVQAYQANNKRVSR